MEPMENTITIIKDVERTHKNLGLPTAFCKVIDLANLGVLIVAERGKGKGAILDVIKQLRHRTVLEVSRLTPAGLVRVAEQLNNREFTIINPDLSALYTDYLKDAVINTLAHLLFDRKLPQSWTGQYSYKIENCTISFLSGVQPKLLRTINKLPYWESMYKDRFLRLCLIYPIGTPDYAKTYPNVREIFLPSSSPDKVHIPDSLKEKEAYKRLKTILQYQTSEGRSGLYLDKLLQASAFLNCRDVVINEDLEFLNLLSVYLLIDYWLSERDEIADSFKFDANSYILLFYFIEHMEAKSKELRQYFRVSQSTITRALQPLKQKGIVTGAFGEKTYYLDTKWFAKYIQPIIDYYKQIGVIK